MSGLTNSSIGRKFAMAISALFLMVFLLQHFAINITSIFSEKVFNQLSHFMGTNPLVQFGLQPVLIFGVLFHFSMGFVLEIKNKKSRSIAYEKYSGSANSNWASRNMILSGVVILSFLILHFIDFWLPEMQYKYVNFLPEDPNRYFEELQHKFVNPIRVVWYVLSFVFLALHLLHGFNSAFQSVGANNKYTKGLKTFSKVYAIGIPLGFIIVALFHHFNH